ncbi:MAG: DUF6431 domain-containing protein [Lachnospiraceae bacterium]|nr:DUF6431 domain-containing protein [Lachnospiraceae bacterium]
MVILFSYTLKQITDSPIIRVIPCECVLCPCCRKGFLAYRDSVRRICRRVTSGKNWIFLIPRGKCPLCGAIRRELPVFLCPYKQYPAAVIYYAIENPRKLSQLKKMCPAERRPHKDTVSDWKKWAGPSFIYLRGLTAYICFSRNARITVAQSLAAFSSKTG